MEDPAPYSLVTLPYTIQGNLTFRVKGTPAEALAAVRATPGDFGLHALAQQDASQEGAIDFFFDDAEADGEGQTQEEQA